LRKLINTYCQASGPTPPDSEKVRCSLAELPPALPPQVVRATAVTDIDPSLRPRPFTQEERQKAWGEANFYVASDGHEQPMALWIIGPSSVGKSTLTAQLGLDFGLKPGEIPNVVQIDRDHLDAVVVDGEFMRDAYEVWHNWVKSESNHHCQAYRAVKSMTNKEKSKMCTEAIRHRKHLVIPQTMLNLHKALTEIEELSRHGYTNHVVAVIAAPELCRQIGEQREALEGK